MNKYPLIAALAVSVSVTIVSGYSLARLNYVQNQETAGKVTEITANPQNIAPVTNTPPQQERVEQVKKVEVPKLPAAACSGAVTTKIVNGIATVHQNGQLITSKDLNSEFADIYQIGETVEAQVEDTAGCFVLISFTTTGKGGVIYYNSNDALLGVNLSTGMHWYTDQFMASDISADGKYVAALPKTFDGASRVSVLDVTSGQVVTDYSLLVAYAEVSLPVWSPDGAQLAVVGAHKFDKQETQVMILDLASQQVTNYQSGINEVLDVKSWVGKYPTVITP